MQKHQYGHVKYRGKREEGCKNQESSLGLGIEATANAEAKEILQHTARSTTTPYLEHFYHSFHQTPIVHTDNIQRCNTSSLVNHHAKTKKYMYIQ